jgi:hypothetical protein
MESLAGGAAYRFSRFARHMSSYPGRGLAAIRNLSRG